MRIGIDLGGTNIRVALINNGQIEKKLSEPCKSQEEEHVVINQIKVLIHELMNQSVESIGIGVPSVVDTEKGIIYNVTNIPSWKEVHLKSILEKEFKVPVKINNDCNCFVYGEYHFGQGSKYDSLVGITLGTGLGCGIIIDNKLYSGHNTGAGEICSIPYKGYNYEYYCSTPFFLEINNISGKEAYEKAIQGDNTALALWAEYGMHLGNMLKIVLLAYDPPCVVIGGSIANAMPFFEESMKASLSDFMYPKSLERLKIYRSEIDDVAILGAAML